MTIIFIKIYFLSKMRHLIFEVIPKFHSQLNKYIIQVFEESHNWN